MRSDLYIYICIRVLERNWSVSNGVPRIHIYIYTDGSFWGLLYIILFLLGRRGVTCWPRRSKPQVSPNTRRIEPNSIPLFLSLSLSLFFIVMISIYFPLFLLLCAPPSLLPPRAAVWKGKEEGSFWHLSRLFVRLCLYAFPPGIAYSYRYIYFFPVYIDWFSPPRNEKLEMIRKRKLIRFFYYEIMSTGLNPISFHFLSWCDSCYLLLKVNLVGLRLAAIRNPNSQELKGCCSSCVLHR